MKLPWRLILGVVLLTVGLACGISSKAFEELAWQGIQDSVNKTFQVRPGGRLVVDADLGSIQVRTGDPSRVDVEVIRKVYAGDRADTESILRDLDLQITQSGNDVTVRAKLPYGYRGWRNFGRNRLQLSFNITVPHAYNVDLNTSGGSIGVDDLQGEVRSRTSGGSLRFGRIQGPVYGRTSGGSIHLEGSNGIADVETSGGGIRIGNVEGDVRAHTSGGSIHIEHAKGTVSAETSGGGIQVEEVMGDIQAGTSGGSISATITQQPRGSCRLSTSGGSVTANLADNIAVNLDAEASGGGVHVDFPVTVQGTIEKHSLRGPINGGGPKLVLRTSGGGVYVRRTGR
ncbi:MAG TPA: DUF4097 family beta strand repeat-containing protein [Acidobacteriota bacterium]|jgi:hypothetical protein|nr:DUF4097 family beta strand repeat-containing protein [Acidobacteriota bacterium]